MGKMYIVFYNLTLYWKKENISSYNKLLIFMIIYIDEKLFFI